MRHGLVRLSHIVLVLALTLPCLWAAPSAPEDVWTGVERVVAVGDIHADFGQFLNALRSAGLIDNQGNWSGGKTHLVQMGDAVDRGPNSRMVLDMLMKLEDQARQAGGDVHVLIGNHDAMNVYGDLRYVSPNDCASFAEDEMAHKTKPASGHPAGFAERFKQFSPEGKYGKWIRSHNAIIRIDDTIFVHAGIDSKYASYSIRDINNRIRDGLRDTPPAQGSIVTDPDGPLWYRGLASGEEKSLDRDVTKILKNFKASRIVIGHTFADGAITPRFNGRVLMADIGLAHLYDQFDRLACLVIENGKPYALHNGKPLELPTDNGKDMLRYLKAAAALDSPPSSLQARIAKLEQALGNNGQN